MLTVRALRRSRGLTLVELALLAGIPARMLGEIEYGLQHLDADSRARLAFVFGLAPDLLGPGTLPTHPRTLGRGRLSGRHLVISPLLAALFSTLLLAPPSPEYRPPPEATASLTLAGRPRTLPRAPSRLVAPAPTLVVPTAAPTTPTPPPAATPASTFALQSDGPHGCPVASGGGRIVITQGYGVGTHAPASVWGALDLAIDGNHDGVPEPSTTRGAAVVATHDGIAQVFLGSWPGGNYVRVEDARSGWSTAYAHLDLVAVEDGQALAAGTPLGTVGSTGFSTGPHLHYEVWYGTQNIDPSGLIGCGDMG